MAQEKKRGGAQTKSPEENAPALVTEKEPEMKHYLCAGGSRGVERKGTPTEPQAGRLAELERQVEQLKVAVFKGKL